MTPEQIEQLRAELKTRKVSYIHEVSGVHKHTIRGFISGSRKTYIGTIEKLYNLFMKKD